VSLQPEAFVDFFLYPTEEGGKEGPINPGYRAPCFVQKDVALGGFSCLFRLDSPLMPGEKRRVGVNFITEDALKVFSPAGKFYLWDGGFVGEATNIVLNS
jgi:hypothetical protein